MRDFWYQKIFISELICWFILSLISLSLALSIHRILLILWKSKRLQRAK